LESQQWRRVMQAADCMTRPTADAIETSDRCELVAYIFPNTSAVRVVTEWTSYRRQGPTIDNMAHHEAGHIVLMEWLGLKSGLKATATPTQGRAHWPHGAFDSLPNVPADPSGVYAATAAAVYHAGLAAEIIFTGAPWYGPVFYPEQTDYQRADDMLCKAFGRHASGAHAYAQRTALAVLSNRWSRVKEIARHLAQLGCWQSEPMPSEPNLHTKDLVHV
jgi:hypothetical protein